MRALAIVALAFLTSPAAAQTERLPAMSRAERQVQDINRALMLQQGQLRQEQQTQFEINQLRSQLQQPAFQPSGRPGCPAGSIC